MPGSSAIGTRFEGRGVVVTGASSGIGRAVALAFAAEGAAIAVNYRSNASGAEEVAANITATGGGAHLVQGDAGDPEQARSLIERSAALLGRIDVLVNNAGLAQSKPFPDTTPADWRKAFDDNFYSAVWTAQAAAPLMREQGGGAIINTTSIRGIDYAGREGLMPYSTAKAALISFTKTLARELAPHVTVNAVAPGFVRTRNYDKMSDAQVEGFLGQTQLGRFIEPEEIAEAYLYLAGSPAVTGHVLVVDGGFLLK